MFMAFLLMAAELIAGVTDLPALTTDETSPQWYTIRNTRSQMYVYYAGDNSVIQDAATLSQASYFYFTGSHSELYIHNAATMNKMSSLSSWTAEGSAWQILVSPYNNGTAGLTIAPQGTIGYNCWNDLTYNNSYTGYAADDPGSVFVLESVTEKINAAIAELEANKDAGNTIVGTYKYNETAYNNLVANKNNPVAATEIIATLDVVMPQPDKLYIIQSAYHAFYETQNVYKAIYNNSLAPMWGTLDISDSNYFWTFEQQPDSGYAIKSVGYNTYIAGAGLISETPVSVELIPLSDKQFQIMINGEILYADGYSDGTGVGGSMASSSSVENTPSAWIIVEKGFYDTVVSLGAMQSSAKLNAITTATKIVVKNLSSSNNYYFAGTSNEQNFLDAILVWEPVVEGEAGAYYLRTADADNGYIQASTGTNAEITLGAKASAQVFTTSAPTTSGSGSTAFTGETLADGSDINNLVRFIQDGSSTWLNVNRYDVKPRLGNTGAGGWTVHNVFLVNEGYDNSTDEEVNGLLPNGVYTIVADVNGQRGYMAAGEGYADYPILSDISWIDFAGNSVTAIENGKNWYVTTKSEGTYIYNLGIDKYLVKSSSDNIDFGDTPYAWSIVENGDYTSIYNDELSRYLSMGCARPAANRPIAWDYNANDGGSQHTFNAVAGGSVTFATQIAAVEAELGAAESTTQNVPTIGTAENGKYHFTSGVISYSAPCNKIRFTLTESGAYYSNGAKRLSFDSFVLYNANGEAVELDNSNFTGNNIADFSKMLDGENDTFAHAEWNNSSATDDWFEITLNNNTDLGGAFSFSFVTENTTMNAKAFNIETSYMEIVEPAAVTYNFTYNGEVKLTQTINVFVGSAYPDYTVSLPFGVSAAAKPAGVVEKDTVVNVLLSVDKLPFVPAESVDGITHWYYMKMHTSWQRFIKYPGGVDYIEWLDTEINSDNSDACTWAFVGNVFDGFKIVNYACGTDSAIVSTGSGNAYMGSIANATKFTVTASGASSVDSVFCMQHPQGAYLNGQNNRLAHWGSNDAGSTMMLVERDMSDTSMLLPLIEEALEAVELLDGTGVPAADLAALNAAISAAQLAAESKEDVPAATKALKEALAKVAPYVPDTNTYYVIQSAFTAFYESQSVYKAMYSNGSAPMWNTLNIDDKSFHWIIEECEGGYSIKNAADGKYIASSTSTSSTPVPATFTDLGDGSYNITVAGDMLHTMGHSGGAGVNGSITHWTAGANTGSAWVIYEVKDFDVTPDDLENWNDLARPHSFTFSGIYRSESGLDGWVEYESEGSGEWQAFTETMATNSEFSAGLTVNFDAAKEVHTIAFRMIDTAGNIKEIETWEFYNVSFDECLDIKDLTYTGDSLYQEALTFNKLDAGKYVITNYTNNVNAGVASFDVEGVYPHSIGKKTYTFNINPLEIEAEIVLSENTFVYDASYKYPQWSFVGDAGSALVQGVDYKVTYTDNYYPGTATLLVEGIGNYSFSSSATFVINKAQLNNTMYSVNIPADMLEGEQSAGAYISNIDGMGNAVFTYVETGTSTLYTTMPTAVGYYDVYVEIAEGTIYSAVERTYVGSFSIYRYHDWEQLCALTEELVSMGWDAPWDISLGVTAVKDFSGLGILQGHTISIDLSGLGLSGTFPTALFSFDFLENVDLSNNNLSGDLPATLYAAVSQQSTQLSSTLTNLDISNNSYEGNVGVLAQCLPALRVLDASYNRFEELYPEISSNVYDLNISNQKISRIVNFDLSNNDATDFINQIPSILLYNHETYSYNTDLNIIVTTADPASFNIYTGSDWAMGLSYVDGEIAINYVSSNNVYRGNSGDEVNAILTNDNTAVGSFKVSMVYEAGDANFISGVDATDLQATILYMFNEYNVNPFNFVAADTYSDDKINVQDIVCMVNILLAKSVSASSMPSKIVSMNGNGISDACVYIENGNVILKSNIPVAALEINSAGNISWDLHRYGMTQMTSDGNLVGYSLSGATLPAGEHIIGTCNGDTRLYGAILSDASANAITTKIGNMNVTSAEQIEYISDDAEFIYDLNGVQQSEIKRGVNIIKIGDKTRKIINNK